MDSVLNKLHKKLTASDKKFNCRLAKCHIFNRTRATRQSGIDGTKSKNASNTFELNEAAIMVERPPPDVRLVLFKEFTETCERKIMFDSKSLEKIQSKTSSCASVENTEVKSQYQYIRTPSDWSVLSEMLFGSVGMAQKAPSLKVHYIKDPPTVMMSRVFCFPSSKDHTVSLGRGIENHFEMQRTNSVYSRRKAKTMPVPSSPGVTTPTSSLALSFSSSGSFFHRSDSSASLTSLLSQQSHTGSLGSSSLRIPTLNSSRANSLPKHQRDSFTLHEEPSTNSDRIPAAIKRMRIGFALLCSPEPSNVTMFQEFFFEHFPIIETYMTTLKNEVEAALKLRKKDFFSTMMEALSNFSSKLQAIYSTPRLPEPVWCTLTSPTLELRSRNVVVTSFISDLSRLVLSHNTKQRNHFFSGLLTAVLTHHLGWVASATPSSDYNQMKDEPPSYNTLWAQLGDLYGAVGSPTKVCRTIVTGSGHEVISTLLSILSYFIRSSRVDQQVAIPDRITPESMGMKLPVPKCVSISMVPSVVQDSDDFVLVSVVDDTDACDVTEQNKTISTITNNSTLIKGSVSRSKSSPNGSLGENSTSNALSRSYSGPMIKQGARSRSNAVLGPNTSIRNRTFSTNAATKIIQSRRKSRDVADVTPSATSNLNHILTPSREKKTLSSTSLNLQGSFCMKKDFAIEWPEIPTHLPGEKINGKNKKMSTSLVNICSDAVVCQLAPSHTDHLLHPPIQHLVNVQRAPPSVQELVISKPNLLRPDKSLRSESPPSDASVAMCARNKEVTKREIPSRSTSNPSSEAKFSVKSQHRRALSQSGIKTRIANRRHPLPSSSQDLADDMDDHPLGNSSFQHLKLLRIPSIDLNHHVFEEYFDEDSPQELQGSNTTDDNSEQNIFSSLMDVPEQTTPHVVSCPDFTSSPPPSVPLQPRKNLQLDIKPIYPDLSHCSDSQCPLPPPRKKSMGSINPPQPAGVRKIYPPLPATPGKMDYFKQTSREDHSAIIKLPKLAPETQESDHNDVTLSYDQTIETEGIEIPLCDVNTNQSRDADEGHPKAATAFASLMADYNPEYLNDFVLHGTPNHPNIHQRILQDLTHMTTNSSLDEPIAEAVCILADTDACAVKVYSSHRLHSNQPSLPALTSKLVGNILTTIAHMHSLKISPEFCLNHLEDELRQLVTRSNMLAEYVRGNKRITVSQLSAVLGIESQDLPLLMAIASCHSPHVAPIML